MRSQDGQAFKSELRAHLLKQGVPEKSARDTVLMLKYFRFAYETTENTEKLRLYDWLNLVSKNLHEKRDLLAALGTGIIAGGYRPKDRGFSHEMEGTRLMLWGLKKAQTENPNRPALSLDELSEIIDERGTMSMYCIAQLLTTPWEHDRYSLAIIGSMGSNRKKATLRLHVDSLHNYQMAAVSSYLSEIIPRLIERKYGVTFRNALIKKMDLINAQSIREELAKYPPVWLSETDRDELIKEFTETCGHEWWAEDRAGGGAGLMEDQHYTYLKVKGLPKPIPLKNDFHGLF